jgi:hypothetical protein
MRGRLPVLALASCVFSTGCLSGFGHPLGSIRESYIDKPLLGTWVCRSSDDPQRIELTFVDFDGRQYLLQSDDHKDRYSDRVLATHVESSTFLSLRQIAPKAEDEWTILQYSFGDAGHLALKLVDPQQFEDVIDDATAVRERLAERLDDPEVIKDLLSCTRQDSPAAQPESESQPAAEQGDEADER